LRRGGATGAGAGAAGGGRGAVAVAASVPAAAWAEGSAVRPGRVALFVEPSPFSYVCGYKNRFENMIRYLREDGDDVMVFVPDRNPPAEFCGAEVMGVPGAFTPPFYKNKNYLLSFALSPFLFARLCKFRPDLVHVAAPGIMVFAAILYAKLMRVPLVMSYHTHIPAYIPKYLPRMLVWLVTPMWAIIRFMHRLADLTLVTSEPLRRELEANHCWGDRIEVWKKGVDTLDFHPRHASREARETMTGGHPDDKVLVYVGRLGAEKNIELLRDVLRLRPDLRLCLVGDGPHRQALEAHFAGTKTVFLGQQTGDALHSYYASADVFAMPSESETLGFVVMEAMASGTPVVGARAGGVPDIIGEGGASGSLLFAPGDAVEMSQQLARLVDDPEYLAAMGQRARAHVEPWGWKAATQHLRSEQYTKARARKAEWLRNPVKRLGRALKGLVTDPEGFLFPGNRLGDRAFS